MADKKNNNDDLDDADEFLDDDLEDVEDDVLADTDKPSQVTPAAKQRDWRDLERYKAERELKKLMEDDWLDDL